MTKSRKCNGLVLTMAWFVVAMTTKTDAQELNVWANGGWQGLSYKLQDGQTRLQPDGSLGVGYTFPFGRHWGLLTGVTGGFYASRATLSNGTYTYDQVDNTGSAFEYRVTTTEYKETQRFFSFGVPVMLQYHTTGSRTQWYLNAGGKLLLPFDANVSASAQQLGLAAYYPDFNLELDNLPQHGFGTVQNWQGATTDKLKSGAALDAETGFSFALSPRIRLYTGLYLEYSLSNMKGDKESSPLVLYNPNGITNVQPGSVLNLANTDNLRALSYGLTVRLGFGGKKHGAVASTGPKVTSAPDTSSTKPSAVGDTAQNRQPPVGTHAKSPADTAMTQKQPTEPPGAQSLVPGGGLASAITREEIKTIQQRVGFGILGKTDLPGDQKPHLDEVAAILQKHPDIRIVITGHTCNIGTVKENARVGEARALSVANYLAGRGVDRRRMDVRSAGESDPMVPNDSPADRSLNRRVTILYLPVSPN